MTGLKEMLIVITRDIRVVIVKSVHVLVLARKCVQKKSYHFPRNNAVGKTKAGRNILAFVKYGCYNENDRVCVLLHIWR